MEETEIEELRSIQECLKEDVQSGRLSKEKRNNAMKGIFEITQLLNSKTETARENMIVNNIRVQANLFLNEDREETKSCYADEMLKLAARLQNLRKEKKRGSN